MIPTTTTEATAEQTGRSMRPANPLGRATQIVRRPAGYTLIEMGIVMAVLGVLAGMVMPDFIELAKNQLAKTAAIQLLEMQDQARIFFHTSMMDPITGNPINPEEARWPGEDGYYTCNPLPLGPRPPPIEELLGAGQLSTGNLNNVWGNPIRADLVTPMWVQPAALANAACSIRFSTDVPIEVAGVIAGHLPGGMCIGCGAGGVPVNFIRCCVYTNKPGIEASLAAARWMIYQ